MGQLIEIHPANPQPRLLQQAAEMIHSGGVVVYPTDSSYALGCHLGDKRALDRIRRIRRLDERHNLTLICRDLAEISTYAKIDNMAYRMLRNLTPGPFTFILCATSEVPRRLQHPKRKTIGIRIPEHVITQALLECVGEPLMSTTMQIPGEDYPMTDPHQIEEVVGYEVDLIIDGGYGGIDATTVIDMVGGYPKLIRQGLGDFNI